MCTNSKSFSGKSQFFSRGEFYRHPVKIPTGNFRDPLPHFAGRWAAKEAFAKAIGCGFGSDCAWQDLEILNDERGKPVMNITGTALQTFEKIGGKTIHLSVSHEKNYATAFVILEGEK